MKYLFFAFVLTGTFLMFSNRTPPSESKVLPVIHIKKWLNNELTMCTVSLEKLKASVNTIQTNKSIIERYNESRMQFKKIEFLIAYIDPEQYSTYINGAPLPKLMKKVPDVTVIEPRGFQRIEELVFEDEINYQELNFLLIELIKELESFTESRINFSLTDPVFFEALRYGILRINTMGVTGFDAPVDSEKALKEVAVSLQGMQLAVGSYHQHFDEEKLLLWNETCDVGVEMLQKGSFDSFDRTKFHKTIAIPLWQQSLDLQKSLHIELPNQRMAFMQALNYESKNMYSDDFLNVAFYGEYVDTENDVSRIALGKILFFDPVLSLNNKRACASCHQPDKGFSDGRKRSLSMDGFNSGYRNAPTIVNSVYAERFFHDLRVDRLANQVDHVVFNSDEFDTDYSEIIEKILQSSEYMKMFEEAYGKEGASKNTITNAIARYVSSLRSYNSEFDRYMRGENENINKSIVKGFNLFSGKAGCATCHFAPTFSGLVPPLFKETESEVLGVPKVNKEPFVLDDDPGRFMNRILMEQVPFYKGSFKTPTLRNIELTGPYMHHGEFETLEEVLELYNNGGGLGIGLEVPFQTLPADALNLSKREQKDIISFMKSLTDTTGLTSKPSFLPKIEGRPSLNSRQIGGSY